MSNPNNEGLIAFVDIGYSIPLSFRRVPNSDYVTVASAEALRFSSYNIKTGAYVTDKMEHVGVLNDEFVGPLLEDSSRSMYHFGPDPKNSRYTIRENIATGERLWGFWSSEVHGLFVFNVPLKPVYFMD